jgi:serine phosphatase RsbU (regulator of sigma subunit)
MKTLFPVFFFLFGPVLIQAQETAEFLQQKKKLDSLARVIKTARHDTTLATAYLNLCEVLYLSDPDTVIPLTKKAEAIINKNLSSGKLNKKEKQVFTSRLASVYNNIGFIYEHQEKTEKALGYYKKSLALQEKCNNEDGAAISRSNIGLLYLNRGDIQQAANLFFENLKRKNRIREKQAICFTLNNLGYLYNLQADTANALKYYRQCLELSRAIGFDNSYANCASNIGIIYIEKKQYDKALVLFEESRDICHKTGDLESEAVALNNIGGVYQKMGKFNEALAAFAEAMEMLKKINSQKYIAYTLSLQGGTYLEKRDIDKALVYLKKSYDLSVTLGYPENIKRSAELLYKAYKLAGHYKESLGAYELYTRMRDSLDNAENKKIAAQKELQYEYEKKAAEVKAAAKSEKEKTDAINLAEKKKQRLIMYTVIAGLVLVLVFAVFIFNRFRVTQKQKKLIEVKEKETQKQKHLVEEKNKEIFDSIDYAERLQRSLMANRELLGDRLREYFIYFNPKEAVSGDFYWASPLHNGSFALAVADSTGHGVPGAIMSMMNMNSLKESVQEKICEPELILDKTRQIIINALANDGSAEGGKDGMDIALLVFNQDMTQLDFALANNPLWLVRNHAVTEYKADKMPVGKHDKQHIPFTKNTIALAKGDMIYAFTDGYADQFGGESGKKFKYKSLQELLLSISQEPVNKQREMLEQRFEQWRQNFEQIDDVCVVGIRMC